VVQEAFRNKFVRTVKVSFITVHEVYAISASTRNEERTHTDVHEDSSIFGIQNAVDDFVTFHLMRKVERCYWMETAALSRHY
jgi:hypothetical protein